MRAASCSASCWSRSAAKWSLTCVPVLAAVALMAEEKDPAQPRSMTLMGGPIDTRVSPTVVNELAHQHPLEWFRKNLISTVPFPHKGMGRKVYPGFLQLTAFMSMNPARHFEQHRRLYQHIVNGEGDAATKIREFYHEYFAVLDLPADFYLETIDKVFPRAALARGELTYRGDPVDLGAIHRTALLTVEGERDDICAVGQTAAAHLLCTGLRPHLKRHHLQPGVGHYGVFSGSKWERQIYPQVRSMVLAVGVSGVFRADHCPGFDPQSYIRHCVGVGLAARALAQVTGRNPELAFTGGILHDIGELVLATCFPEQYAKALAYRALHDCTPVAAERDILGLDHAVVGGLLADTWRFPPSLYSAVAEHHSPSAATADSLADLIHLADSIAHGLGLATAQLQLGQLGGPFTRCVQGLADFGGCAHRLPPVPRAATSAWVSFSSACR